MLQLFVNLLAGAAAVIAFAEGWAWLRAGDRGDFSAVVLVVVAFASLLSQGLPYSVAGIMNTEGMLALGFGLIGFLVALGAASLPDHVADFRLVQAVVEAKGRAELMLLRTASALGSGGIPMAGTGTASTEGTERQDVIDGDADGVDQYVPEEGSMVINQTEVAAQDAAAALAGTGTGTGTNEAAGVFGELGSDWEEEDEGMSWSASAGLGDEGGLEIMPGAAEQAGSGDGEGEGALSDAVAAAGVRLFAAAVAGLVAVLLFRPAIWTARTYFASTRGPDRLRVPLWRRVFLMFVFFAPLFLSLSWLRPIFGDLILAGDLVKCNAAALARDCVVLPRPPAPVRDTILEYALDWAQPWTWETSRVYLTESQWLAIRLWVALVWGAAHLLTIRTHAEQHLVLARRHIRDTLWVVTASPRPPIMEAVYKTCNASSVR